MQKSTMFRFSNCRKNTIVIESLAVSTNSFYWPQACIIFLVSKKWALSEKLRREMWSYLLFVKKAYIYFVVDQGIHCLNLKNYSTLSWSFIEFGLRAAKNKNHLHFPFGGEICGQNMSLRLKKDKWRLPWQWSISWP